MELLAPLNFTAFKKRITTGKFGAFGNEYELPVTLALAWTRFFGDSDSASHVALSSSFSPMKWFFTILLSVFAGVLQAGVPSVTIFIKQVNPAGLGASTTVFQLQVHTSYAPFGYSSYGSVYLPLPGMINGQVLQMTLDTSVMSPNYPTADWVCIHMGGAWNFTSPHVSLLQTNGYNNPAWCPLEFDINYQGGIITTNFLVTLPPLGNQSTNGVVRLLHFQKKDGTKATRFIKLKRK